MSVLLRHGVRGLSRLCGPAGVQAGGIPRAATAPALLAGFHHGATVEPGRGQGDCPRPLGSGRMPSSPMPWAARGASSAVLPGYNYDVIIHTGSLRGAGSHAPAVIKMFGNEGSSDDIPLGDEDDEGFVTGQVRTFRISTGWELGDLRRLEVKQVDLGMGSTGGGWYLDQVTVVSVDTGEQWVFPCRGWFGESDCGGKSGPRSRALPVQTQWAEGAAEAVESPPVVPMSFISSVATVPHPKKIREGIKAVISKDVGHGGEDAYLMFRDGPRAVVAVADGVYMWKKLGIDAGLWSRALVAHVQAELQGGTPVLGDALAAAFERTLKDGVQGSSTVCLVEVDLDTGRVESANSGGRSPQKRISTGILPISSLKTDLIGAVGDSGFIILGAMPEDMGQAPGVAGKHYAKFRSPHQEHDFGRPFQLGHHEHSDRAEDAMLAASSVAPGDIIVAGSDGLFDNLADEEICEAADDFFAKQALRGVSASAAAKGLAAHLTSLAYNYSQEKDRSTPYSTAATEAFNMVYNGGKKDDITVVAMLLTEREARLRF